jgi:hypothetical protein
VQQLCVCVLNLGTSMYTHSAHAPASTGYSSTAKRMAKRAGGARVLNLVLYFVSKVRTSTIYSTAVPRTTTAGTSTRNLEPGITRSVRVPSARRFSWYTCWYDWVGTKFHSKFSVYFL